MTPTIGLVGLSALIDLNSRCPHERIFHVGSPVIREADANENSSPTNSLGIDRRIFVRDADIGERSNRATGNGATC
ncbi:MAG: hypothetical protein ABIO62_13200 [Paracoccaceae bacterium]